MDRLYSFWVGVWSVFFLDISYIFWVAGWRFGFLVVFFVLCIYDFIRVL